MKKFSGACLLLVLLGAIPACSNVKAPVTARQGPDRQEVPVITSDTARQASDSARHTVSKGETLYSIAWRYGHDYKSLAAWNRIKPPFTIYPGQVIKLIPVRKSRALQPPPVEKKQPVKPDRPAALTRETTPTTTAGIRWQWPARGKLLKSSTPTAKKGISIGGRTGQKIVAAATGTVVYSGSGLRGYGNLIIIKHNETYLSAYAHNRDLIVREGETVKGGQQISTMGVDGKGAPVLHFEIRKNGQPVDPLGQLPRT
ncbi:MAG: peptidoglycan DD-metalloendopeptidase family protein [Gammaproteobacteria bacterium]|nr:peptidoglycan DD-metalloendopeptidase family protein [Gammaproteobacteria bacterium]